MRSSLLVSVLLHALLVLLAIFGLPAPDRQLDVTPPIEIEVVDAGELAAPRPPAPAPQPAPVPAPKPVQAAPAPPPKPDTPPPEPVAAPEPPKLAEAVPTPREPVAPERPPPAPEPPPLPKPAPKPEPAVEPEPPKPEPPKPQPPKPQPKPEPKKPEPKPDAMAALLRNVLKPTDQAPPKPEQIAAAPTAAPKFADHLSASEIDIIRQQMQGCWSAPVGMVDAGDVIVSVVLDIDPDGTVRSAEITDQSRMQSDRVFRAAGESVMRALRNPLCNPLKLPPGRYNEWKHITFNFNTKDML